MLRNVVRAIYKPVTTARRCPQFSILTNPHQPNSIMRWLIISTATYVTTAQSQLDPRSRVRSPAPTIAFHVTKQLIETLG